MPTSTHPPKWKYPRAGADGRYCTGFRFRPCKMPRKTQHFPFRAVGVDAYIDPPSKTETPPCGGGWTLLYWVSFSPLQKTSQNATFSLSRRRGRCLHRPAGIARFMAVFRRIRVGFLFCTVGVDAYLGAKSRVLPVSRRRGRCLHRPTLQNGNTPARGRMDVIVQGFNFHPVGADDPVRPPELPGFMEIQCQIATF